MNRHNAYAYLPLVAALAASKTIQAYRGQPGGSIAWEDFGPDDEVLFTCPPHLYRVKPE